MMRDRFGDRLGHPLGRPFAHPSHADLALYSSADLPFWQQWRIERHVKNCAACGAEVEKFRDTAAKLKQHFMAAESTLLDRTLEREMIGNINVGVAAANCISEGRHRRVRGWSLGALCVTLAMVFLIGWIMNIPHQDSSRVLSALENAFNRGGNKVNTVLRTTPLGVSVRSQGGTLTILRPATAHATAAFTGDGSVAVRYVDNETGQVTITNVYGQ
jgi:hypothetical protein